MNLRQLEAFRATMRSDSISGAAKLLHISQPSISRLISDLEHTVGFSLFVRTGRGVIATVEARRFQQSVESMFFGLDKLKEITESIRTTKDETISLGVIPVFSSSVMPDAVNAHRIKQTDIHLSIGVKNTPEIIDAVLMQQLDLGVICPISPLEGIHVLYSTAVNYRCLVPANHNLANSKMDIDLGKVSEEVITLDPSYLEEISNDEIAMKNIRKHIRIVCHSDPAIAALARSTGLMAVVDPFTASIAAADKQMVSLPIKQNIRYPIAVICRSAETLSLAATNLSNHLIRAFESIERR